MNSALNHMPSIPEIADLLQFDVSILRRVFIANRAPVCWKWRKSWSNPRWPESSVPQWLHVLSSVDVPSLPPDPINLERPEVVFSESRRGPTAKELATAARMCGIK